MGKRRLLCMFTAIIVGLLLCSGMAFASQAVVDNDFNRYEHQPRFDDTIIIDGIDVSAWQDTVDWKKVKRSGIDYVFIRVGWTGLDSPFGTHKDSCFEKHYKGAREAGLLVGVYYYSCATTETEGKKEAKKVLSILDGRRLDLPVVFDYEYAGRIAGKGIGKTKATNTIQAFFKYIRNNSSYDTMFYSYRSIMDPTWSPKFYIKKIDASHRIWVAQYYTDIETYSRPFEFWQYTSSGNVPGIDGYADCNFWYFDEDNYPVKSGKLSIKKATISLSKSKYTYTTFEKKPTVKVTRNGTTLKEGTHYRKFYIKNVNAGTAYVMIKGIGKYSGIKMRKFTIEKADFASNCKVGYPDARTYSGSAQKPTVKVTHNGKTLKRNIDYRITYENNIKAGTATMIVKGKRNFSGSVKRKFTIKKKNLSSLQAKLSYSVAAYTGKSRYPKVTIKGLKKDRDFTVKYRNHKEIGTATVTITGKGNYKGTQEKKFTIRLKSPDDVKARLRENKSKGYNDIKVTWSPIYSASGYRVFYRTKGSSTWKSKTLRGNKSTSKTFYDLKAGTTYQFRVMARSSKGDSIRSSTVSCTTLKRVEQQDVKLYSSRKSKVTVSWKNVTGESGYEISRSARKNGINVVEAVKSTSAARKILSVPKGKTYYYRVRAYKKINDTKVYGPWSASKKYKVQL